MMRSVTLGCERSEPRRVTARAVHPSRAALRPPQDDGSKSFLPEPIEADDLGARSGGWLGLRVGSRKRVGLIRSAGRFLSRDLRLGRLGGGIDFAFQLGIGRRELQTELNGRIEERGHGLERY